jgi:hypothetical protein
LADDFGAGRLNMIHPMNTMNPAISNTLPSILMMSMIRTNAISARIAMTQYLSALDMSLPVVVMVETQRALEVRSVPTIKVSLLRNSQTYHKLDLNIILTTMYSLVNANYPYNLIGLKLF